MSCRVVLTGRAALTPLGNAPTEIFERLCAGERAIAEVELAVPAGAAATAGRLIGARVANFQPADYLPRRTLRALDRPAALLSSAAKLALADAGLSSGDTANGGEIGVVVGSRYSSMSTIASFDRRVLDEGPRCASPMDFANTVLNAAAGQTAIQHGLRELNATIAAGASSGLRAIAYAVDLVRSGRAVALLAGGVEELSYESALALRGTDRLSESVAGATPFAANREGVAPAEGVGLLVVEELEHARARGARILAEFGGNASGFDPRAPGSEPSVDVLTRIAASAIAASGLEASAIDLVSTGGSGSPELDRAEARALAEVVDPAAAWIAVKAALGEGLGSASALQVLVAAECICDGRVPGISGLTTPEPGLLVPADSAQTRRVHPSQALVLSVGSDDLSCALVLSRWRPE